MFPKGIDFYEMFDMASDNLKKAVGNLKDLLKNIGSIEEKSKTIYELEKDNDLVTHEIMRRLNKTFITPIDREDIHELASTIDDIMDSIWAAVDRMKIFKIDYIQDGAVEIADSLERNIDTVSKALHSLKTKKYTYVQELCIEINRLENEADRVFKSSLGKLFEQEKDPINIIKWKEIFEDLENAANSCEDVANILEAVVLKNA